MKEKYKRTYSYTIVPNITETGDQIYDLWQVSDRDPPFKLIAKSPYRTKLEAAIGHLRSNQLPEASENIIQGSHADTDEVRPPESKAFTLDERAKARELATQLTSAFSWSTSVRGQDYWRDVYQSLCNVSQSERCACGKHEWALVYTQIRDSTGRIHTANECQPE